MDQALGVTVNNFQSLRARIFNVRVALDQEQECQTRNVEEPFEAFSCAFRAWSRNVKYQTKECGARACEVGLAQLSMNF